MFAAVRPPDPADEEAILTAARARLARGARLAVVTSVRAGRRYPLRSPLRW
jgi:hypothetical protein